MLCCDYNTTAKHMQERNIFCPPDVAIIPKVCLQKHLLRTYLIDYWARFFKAKIWGDFEKVGGVPLTHCKENGLVI